MTAPTRIILCADDYAMSESVSRGIVRLARSGRVSATSVMAGSPHWPAVAGALKSVASEVAVGLHLTLTWGRPLGPMPRLAPTGAFPSLGRLTRDALLGRLSRGASQIELRAEIGRQLDRFEEIWGEPPAFVDGHQHAHILPGIRTALLATVTARGYAGRVWLRDPSDRPVAILKRGGTVSKAVIVAALSTGFSRAARRSGFNTNRGFSGFSSFARTRDVAAEFAQHLTAPGPSHVVMCHPGDVGPDEVLDGVVEARRRELDLLSSDEFRAILTRRRVVLTRNP